VAVRPGFTEPQRARWVALASVAADEARLPADSEVRAALASYLEWSSRAASAAAPQWDWGPAGPPAEEPVPAAADHDTEQVTLPGPDETVSFEAHIKPLFREHDRTSMSTSARGAGDQLLVVILIGLPAPRPVPHLLPEVLEIGTKDPLPRSSQTPSQ
jgi:hypothetical protein